MKKKKLIPMLLALTVSVSGGAAMLSGCTGNPETPKPGPNQEVKYTVTFYGEDKTTTITTKQVASGATVEAATLPEKAGYTASWVDATGAAVDFSAKITADAAFYAKYTANTNTAYKVEHYFENAEGVYELNAAMTENLTGTTDATVTATAKNEAHYTQTENANAVLTGTVKGDGSLVLKVYYAKERITVKFMADGVELDSAEVIYGGKVAVTEEEVPAKDKTAEEEWAFTHWSATENGAPYNFDAAVEAPLTLYAVYEKTARTYSLDANMYVEGLYYFASDAEGSAWVDSEDFDQEKITYNTEFAFKLELAGAEVTGTPVVTLTKIDDEGNAGAPETLTADANGFYTITVNSNMKLEITGLQKRMYDVTVNATVASYAVDWAATCKATDVVAEIVDSTGAATYHANVLKDNGTAVLSLPMGTYTLTFVISDGQGGYTAVAAPVQFEANSTKVEEGTNVIMLEGEYVIGVPSVTISNNDDDNWTINNGVITGKVQGKDESGNYRQMWATFDNFAPKTEDFAVTVTYQLDLGKATTESDPSFGFVFSYDGKTLNPFFNKTGFRLRNITADQYDKNGFLPGGNMLSKDAKGYDKVTLIAVRQGKAMYLFLSGERTNDASVAKTNMKLMAIINEKGFNFCDGSIIPVGETTIAAFLAAEITDVKFVIEQSSSCAAQVYGYGYTTDAAVVAQYVNMTKATATFTGSVEKTQNLVIGDNKIDLEVAAGKVVKTLTVNGVNTPYTLTETGITFNIEVPFDGGNFAVNVEYADGTYSAKVVGYVKANGQPYAAAKVTDGRLTTYADANGKFELLTVAAESYTLTAEAEGYKPTTVTVTDIAKEVEINLSQWEVGGVAKIGDKAYSTGAANACEFGLGDTTCVYDLQLDENGNTIAKSVASSGYRNPLIYSNFSAEQFVVKGAVTYETVKDPYIRFGFVVTDAAGNRGTMMYYGETKNAAVSNVESGWKNYASIEDPGVKLNGNAQNWINAGKIEVAMIYDKGNVDFYIRCVKGFNKDKWIHLYNGVIFTSDGKVINGPVVVGLMETQNQNSAYTFSDFYIAEGLGNLTIDPVDGATVTNENGTITIEPAADKQVADVKLNGVSVLGDCTNSGMNVIYTMPAMWQLNGAQKLTVEVKERSQAITAKGTVTADGKALEGVTVSLINAEGTIVNTMTTDANGAYTVLDATAKDAGEYTVTFEKAGYFLKSGKKALIFGDNEINVEMYKTFFVTTHANTVMTAEVNTALDAVQNNVDTYSFGATGKGNQYFKSADKFLAKGQYMTYTLKFDAGNGYRISNTKDADSDMYYQLGIGGKGFCLTSSGCTTGTWDKDNYPSATASGIQPFDMSMDKAQVGIDKPIYQQMYDFAIVREGDKTYLYGKYNGTAEWLLLYTADIADKLVGIDYYSITARSGFDVFFTIADITIGNDVKDITDTVWTVDGYKADRLDSWYSSAGRTTLANGNVMYNINVNRAFGNNKGSAAYTPKNPYNAVAKTISYSGDMTMRIGNADWSQAGWGFASADFDETGKAINRKQFTISLRSDGNTNHFFIAMNSLGDAYNNRYSSLTAANADAGLLVCDPNAMGILKNNIRQYSFEWIIKDYRFQLYIGEFKKDATKLILDIDMKQFTSTVAVAKDGNGDGVAETKKWGGTHEQSADKIFPDMTKINFAQVIVSDTTDYWGANTYEYVENAIAKVLPVETAATTFTGYSNGGLNYNAENKTLTVKKDVGGTQESAFEGVTFTPATDVMEMGWTLTGMQSDNFMYPLMGMFVGDGNGVMRMVWRNAGDVLGFMLKEDWASRTYAGVTKEEWVPFGSKVNYYTWQAAKEYVKAGEYKLTVKVRVEGYKISVWAKTSETLKVDNNWVPILDKFDVKAWYSDGGVCESSGNPKANHVNTIYDLNKPCQFGISARRDANAEDKNVAVFSDMWYKVDNNAKA